MEPNTSQHSQGNQGASDPQAGQSNIPAAVLQKYPELVKMIQKTESMSKEERDYWFQILPIMTEDQVNRLRKILEDEAAQLAKLDDEYQEELSELNKKHLAEWKAFENKQEREKLQKAEAGHEKEEAAAEEALLGELEGIDDEPGQMAA